MVCAGIFLLSAACLLATGRGFSAYPGQREWIISFCLFVASLLSITLRLYDQFLASVLFGNLFQFSAYYFLALGSLRFLGEDFKEHWVATVFLVFILVLMGTLSFESNFLNARLAVVSFLAAVFSFATAFFFKIFSTGEYRYERFTQYVFYFHGVFSVAKGLVTLIDHDRDGLFSKTLVSQLTFYEYILITFLFGLCLNLLGAQRLKSEKLKGNCGNSVIA
jgi:hypothetical protein